MPRNPATTPHAALATLVAQPHWRMVDVLSDTHLDSHAAGTFLAWRRYLETTPAQAVLILGDLFEVWLGDDVVGSRNSLPNRHEGLGFEDRALRTLRFASERLSLHIMVGNRDFLLGQSAMAACNASALPDPCVLAAGPAPGQRVLLSHGDSWCTDDLPYQQFKAQVRTSVWQRDFLAQPLEQRKQQAAQMRMHSKAAQGQHPPIDVNPSAVAQAATEAQCATVIHGHTHEGRSHLMAGCGMRHVTRDWHAATDANLDAQAAKHAKAPEVLRLTRNAQDAWDVARILV